MEKLLDLLYLYLNVQMISVFFYFVFSNNILYTTISSSVLNVVAIQVAVVCKCLPVNLYVCWCAEAQVVASNLAAMQVNQIIRSVSSPV